jgi:Flp pilus assembly pilin Flp
MNSTLAPTTDFPLQCTRTSSLVRDARGAVLVEYSVLVGAMAIAGALGLVAVGISLVRSFEFARALLLCPIP